MKASRQANTRGGKEVVAALRTGFEEQGLEVRTVETHISWVLLAGAFAYKIKKPVRFEFLDFSTLEARRQCCDEELRLNRRLAASMYIGVVAIHADASSGGTLGGDGPVVEYAVKMHRLPPLALASERLARGLLEPHHLSTFAGRLSIFHREAAAATPASGYGTPLAVRSEALRALDALAPLADPPVFAELRRWFDAQNERLAAPWQQRLVDGRVREGHGDLHLDNVIVLDDDVTAFDCIEFNPALRWIDVMSDVAFLGMDLLAHGRRDLAFGFLNAYLEASGDYAGIGVLRFYLVYRALVRALVTALREKQHLGGAGLRSLDYLRLALRLARANQPRLLITHGLPGAGKSHVSQQLIERAGAIRVRSDVERRRLFSDGSRYSGSASEQTYGRLADLAGGALRAGFPVVVDAAFLMHDERERMHHLADELHVPFNILDCQAPMVVLRERVRERAQRGGDASEADLPVLERLARRQQPLDERERAVAIEVHAGEPVAMATLVGRWLAEPAPAS
jgi:uncharacterized protein